MISVLKGTKLVVAILFSKRSLDFTKRDGSEDYNILSITFSFTVSLRTADTSHVIAGVCFSHVTVALHRCLSPVVMLNKTRYVTM